MLWRVAFAGGDVPARIQGARGRTYRRARVIALCETRNRNRRSLQPLFAVAHGGGALRTHPARLRRRTESEGVRTGRIYRRRAASTRSMRAVISGFVRITEPKNPGCTGQKVTSLPKRPGLRTVRV